MVPGKRKAIASVNFAGHPSLAEGLELVNHGLMGEDGLGPRLKEGTSDSAVRRPGPEVRHIPTLERCARLGQAHPVLEARAGSPLVASEEITHTFQDLLESVLCLVVFVLVPGIV